MSSMIRRVIIKPSLASADCVRIGKRWSSATSSKGRSSDVEFMSLGLLSGFAGSLVGLAGGFVAVPFLTGYFGLVQNIAHGTSMAVVFATSLGASFAYAQKLDINDESPATSEVFHDIPLIGSVPVIVGNVHVLNAACVALTSSMSIIAGAVLSKRLPAAHLKLAMGCAFMIVGPMIPFQKHFRSASRPSEASKLQVAGKLHGLYHKHETVLKPLMIGLFSGLWAGILGVGGGVIIVPALCFFTDMDYKMALATSLASIFPTSIVGAITQFRQGQLIPRIGAPLAVGCLIGSYVGGRYGKRIEDQNLKYCFAGVMWVMGVRTIRQALKVLR